MTTRNIINYFSICSSFIKNLAVTVPSELENKIRVFVNYYNHNRYHEALKNVTPADMYYGRDHEVLERRKQVKQKSPLRLAEIAGKVYMSAETIS